VNQAYNRHHEVGSRTVLGLVPSTRNQLHKEKTSHCPPHEESYEEYNIYIQYSSLCPTSNVVQFH